jgi:hypothetical protein
VVVRPLVVGGVLLLVMGLVILAGASDGLDRRMPTQVLPRRFAAYAFACGAALLATAGIVSLFP